MSLQELKLRYLPRLEAVFTWDNFLRVAGIAGIAHETLIASAERPTLLVLFGAMIGLPSFLKKDKESE